MTFAAVTFAETSFCADKRFSIIGSFPIFPLNGNILAFIMALNFDANYDVRLNSRLDFKSNINTSVDTDGVINTEHDYAEKINRQHDYILIR